MQNVFFFLDQGRAPFPVCIETSALILPSGQGADQWAVFRRCLCFIAHLASPSPLTNAHYSIAQERLLVLYPSLGDNNSTAVSFTYHHPADQPNLPGGLAVRNRMVCQSRNHGIGFRSRRKQGLAANAPGQSLQCHRAPPY